MLRSTLRSKDASTSLADHFSSYRENIVGIHHSISTPFHAAIKVLYADWTATGRAYGPIERRMYDAILPFLANTHTETSTTGKAMTHAYQTARQMIKRHVNANDDDVLITEGSGMTGAVNRLQRILGMRIHERFQHRVALREAERPVVFITHMEHHSNQTSWLETIADVVVVEPDASGLVDPENFRAAVKRYGSRTTKIASVTACSNVTGIHTPYHAIAKILHQAGGLCFVDFACAAPHVAMDMHPADPLERLDAIFFSPHKFLGGVGTPGILVFSKALYHNQVPDLPGGGTVAWTNPWGEHRFVDAIEEREDGGTPAFVQTIRAALCMQLKEQMGVEKMREREQAQIAQLMAALSGLPNLHILAAQHTERLAILSFYIDDLHHNLAVRLLNDHFGIQVRGGCSCAGTYGHHLLNVSKSQSKMISDQIDRQDYSSKPGWVRISLHPTMTDAETGFIATAVTALAQNHQTWARDYVFDSSTQNLTFRMPQLDDKIALHMNQCMYEALD